MADSGKTRSGNSRQDKIDQLAATIKKHPWYENEPIENCRKMAEYQISQYENKTEQREITSTAYINSQHKLAKKVSDWLGK